MKIDPVLVSDEYLNNLRREATGDVSTTASEQELSRVRFLLGHIAALMQSALSSPIPMRLICPACSAPHIDEGEFATKPHHTHACQSCGNVWRPAIVATVGVQFLPGFKNGGVP